MYHIPCSLDAQNFTQLLLQPFSQIRYSNHTHSIINAFLALGQ